MTFPIIPDFAFERKEVAQALLAELRLTPHLAIYDIRKVGKSHFLSYDLLPAAQSMGLYVVEHDFLAGRRDQQVAFMEKLTVAGGSQSTLVKLKAWIARLSLKDARRGPRRPKSAPKVAGRTVVAKFGNKVAEAGIELGETYEKSQPEVVEAVRLLTDAFEEMAASHPRGVLLILDEIQELAKGTAAEVRANANLLKALRASLLKTKSVHCIFAGSDEKLLKQMFEHYAHVMFGLADAFTLPRLGADFLEAYLNHFESDPRVPVKLVPVARAVLERAFGGDFQNSPTRVAAFLRQYRQSAARFANSGPGTEEGDAIVRAATEQLVGDIMRRFPVRPDYAANFDSFDALDKAILVGFSAGHTEPFAEGNLTRLSGCAGRTVDHSMLQYRINRFCGDKGVRTGEDVILTARSEVSGYEFLDPEFKEWITVHAGLLSIGAPGAA
jgi:hypothetical protein